MNAVTALPAQSAADSQQARNPSSIAVIDDDAEYLEFLTEYLKARGITVASFSDGEAFLRDPDHLAYDFYVIDLMLPGIDGVDIVGLLRSRAPQAGILIVSGRLGPESFNSGLAAGADMFLSKPVRFDQIIFAINSVQRRLARSGTAGQGWQLDAALKVLSYGSVRIPLTGTEKRLIEILAKNGPEPMSRELLIEALGLERGSSVRNLDAAIYRLRKKIEDVTGQSAPLKTVHGLGYSLKSPVSIITQG